MVHGRRDRARLEGVILRFRSPGNFRFVFLGFLSLLHFLYLARLGFSRLGREVLAKLPRRNTLRARR